VDFSLLNELLLTSQRAHLQRIMRRRMAAEERDVARAKIIRERLWPAIRQLENVEHEPPAKDEHDEETP